MHINGDLCARYVIIALHAWHQAACTALFLILTIGYRIVVTWDLMHQYDAGSDSDREERGKEKESE